MRSSFAINSGFSSLTRSLGELEESLSVNSFGFSRLRMKSTVQIIRGIPPQTLTSSLIKLSSRLPSLFVNRAADSSSLSGPKSITSIGKLYVSRDVRIS